VCASTPVEVLLLSKYDVFHRLSRSARETLRAAAQSHAESIVYLDRFHKTQKWEAYKRKVLREHVNHERIEKILPSAAVASRSAAAKPPAKSSQSRQAATVSRDSKGDTPRSSVGVTLPPLPVPLSADSGKTPDSSRSSASSNTARQALVPANELLLLAQETTAVKKCFNPEQTLGNFVLSFNMDALPSSARQRQLESVLAAEAQRQAEVLMEGNPLAFFDIKVEEKQIGASWSRTERQDGVSTAPDSPRAASVSPLRQPPPSTQNAGKSLKITSQALSQLLQENFIFSRPAEGKAEGHDARRGRLLQTKGALMNAVRKVSSPARARSPSRFNGDRAQPESSSDVDYVVLAFKGEDSEERPEGTSAPKKTPAFQIVQSARSFPAVRDAVERLQGSVGAAGLKFYALPLKTFALLPRADRSRVDEERLQLQQLGEVTGGSQRMRAMSSLSLEESTASLQSPGDSLVHFSSFQEVTVSVAADSNEARTSLAGSTVDVLPPSSPRGGNHATSPLPRRKTFNAAAGSARNSFAVASVVLSKLEAAHSRYEEPFVSVHELFSSEMEAVTYAMGLKPAQSLKSAMLCVFPIGKWIRLEHAHDWCVQVEANKREKRAPSFSRVSALPASPTSPAMASPNARSRRLTLVPEPPKPVWEQQRDEAKRLHSFICARMGAPVVDKKKDRTEESGGFTPQPLVSLEDKLDTLHDYLQATASFTARTGHGGVAMLKYRQVKRFGSIMRSRIAGTVPKSNNSNNSSPSPRASFSTITPG
jgi:hypothetical protein